MGLTPNMKENNKTEEKQRGACQKRVANPNGALGPKRGTIL